MMTTMMWIALKATVILAGAGVASVLLRRASASLRHLVWAAALTAVLAIPFVEAMGLEVRVQVPASWLSAEVSAEPALAHVPAESPPAVAAPVVPDVRPSLPETLERTPRSSTVAVPNEVPSRESARAVAAVPTTSAAASVASESTGESATGLEWYHALAWAWGLGTLGLLMTTAASHWAAYRITRSAVRVPPTRVREALDMMVARAGIRRPVRLVMSTRLSIPATWGVHAHTIVLPSAAVAWSDERLGRVLLHELAHVRRNDCALQLVGDLARAVHWVNPLAWLAVARLRAESERAADDEVITGGDAPSAYANDLVQMARSLREPSEVPTAVLAMAGQGGLGSRVRSILDPDQPRSRLGGTATVGACATAVGIAFALTGVVAVAQERPEPPAPEVDAAEAAPLATPVAVPTADLVHESVEVPSPAPIAPPASSAVFDQSAELCVFRSESGRLSNSITSRDGNVRRIRWETADCKAEIDIEGEVTFEPDDTGVRTMANGSLFEIREEIGRSSRRIRMSGERNGIERRFWVDGDRRDWGPEAEAWLARVLPELFRHTTINAEARVRRMLASGGPERVFQEVGQMRSDHVRRTYLELMMQEVDLSEQQYSRVLDIAGQLDSDHSSSELLIAVVEKAGLRPAFQGPLLRATESMESDHQKTRVLQLLLESELTTAQFDAVVRSAQTIESDHNLGEVLRVVAERGDLSAAGRASFMETLSTIESDHQLEMVLQAFLDSGRLDGGELNAVLAMTRDIESDHSLAQVLQRVVGEYDLANSQVEAFLAAAERLESDHQMATTASVLLDHAQLSSQQLALVFELAERIESDHQRSMVLSQIIDSGDLGSADRRRLLEVASGIESDHQLGTVLTQLVDHVVLDDEGVLAVLQVARSMESDHSQAQVLTNLAERAEINGAALDLYRSLADELSRHQRDQVLAMIARR